MPTIFGKQKHETAGGGGPTSLYTGRESYEGFGGYNRVAHVEPHLKTSVGQRTKRTWDGVFLPVSLSVFGFVLFVRLPWMVGECGLWLTLIGICICYSVTLLTTISLAAISTNGFTGDGGPYMMISRCLGPQIGTTVGLTFVLANIVATAMYLVGGVTVVVGAFPSSFLEHWHNTHPYGTTVLLSSAMLLVLLLISCGKVEKVFRSLCFMLTLLSVVDVVMFILRSTNRSGDAPLPPGVAYNASSYPESDAFLGLSADVWRRNWSPDFSASTTFQSALSILFPGVTGLMSGVCLSGELKNGAKAIPRGIAYAWVMSLLIYVLMAVLVAGSMERDVLKQHFSVLRYASDEYVYLPGEVCASFAAGLSMMVGSSRVLLAIARDELLPFRWVRWLRSATTTRALFSYWAAIQLLLFVGDAYAYASVFATQVFCANFLALNLSTFLSSATGTPSFRPVYAFFNTTTALFGACLCVMVMFYINPLLAAAVLVLMGGIFVVADLSIDTSKVYWGDASQPLVFYLVRKWLLRLDERKEHIRHWRPSIMQVVTDPLCSLNLIHLANNLKKGGLYEVCLVVEGDFQSTTSNCFRWKGWLMDFIGATGVKAFAVVTFGESLRPAVQSLMRTSGLGGMRPNTVLLSMDELLQREYFKKVYDSYSMTVAGSTNSGHIAGGGCIDFGQVRPLRDVNNRATEFWDMRRDAPGNIISASTAAAGGVGLAADHRRSAAAATAERNRSPRVSERTKLLGESSNTGGLREGSEIETDGSDSDESPRVRRSHTQVAHQQHSKQPQERAPRTSAEATSKPLATTRRSSAAAPTVAQQQQLRDLDVDELAGTLRLGTTFRNLTLAAAARASTLGGLDQGGSQEPQRSRRASQLCVHHGGAAELSAAADPYTDASAVVRMSTSIINSELRNASSTMAMGRHGMRTSDTTSKQELEEVPSTPPIGLGFVVMSEPTVAAVGSVPSRASLEAAEVLSVEDELDPRSPSRGRSSEPRGEETTSSNENVAATAPSEVQPSGRSFFEFAPRATPGFSAWLRKAMRMQITVASSPAISVTPPAASGAATTKPPQRGYPAGGNDQQSAQRFLSESVARAHEIKRPSQWGLFRTAIGKRSGSSNSASSLEEILLERMIAQRHAARLSGDPDLSTYSDILEFCAISKDVAAMQMSLLLARNMDRLNMEELAQRSKGEIFIDIWIPHDSDSILYLMGHCFSMTSIWRLKGVLRVVSVVSTGDEVEDEVRRLTLLLREHRLRATVVVVTLEAEMNARGIEPGDMEMLLESPEGRAEVLNAVMRREMEACGNRTAVIFMRVESYMGPDRGKAGDDASEAWFANLVTLSHQLPAMLLLAAGNLKCRSNEW